MTSFVMISEQAWPTNTKDQIADAKEALRKAGRESAEVWTGEPGDPDAYPNKQILFAETTKAEKRKARVAERKLERARSAAYDLAKARAESNGYRILARLAANAVPRAWRVATTTGDWPHRTTWEHGGPTSIFDTEQGRVHWTWGFNDSSKILGVLRFGDGYDAAVFVNCDDATAFAVGAAQIDGTNEFVASLVELPGVTMERFRKVGT